MHAQLQELISLYPTHAVEILKNLLDSDHLSPDTVGALQQLGLAALQRDESN
jgi:hypothetical protein